MLRISLLAALALMISACSSVQTATPTSTQAPTVPSEQDRKAILAMVGDYRVKFEFEETLALKAGYTLHKPHVSDAYEYVQVLENSPRRIVLQHILVEEGGRVTKHWRQDWEYEQTRLWSYAGNYSWQRRDLSADAVRGQWVQTVWQVDDSPRYAGVGRWEHDNGVSRWTSDSTWRPLPRREHTERDDYDVLVSTNRQTITPTGWSHEQDSYKLDRKNNQILAFERGNNTYTSVKDFDFKAGHNYWSKTAPYWEAVRNVWANEFAQHTTIGLVQPTNEEFMTDSHFMAVMKQANNLDINAKPLADREAAVRATLKPFLILDGKTPEAKPKSKDAVAANH